MGKYNYRRHKKIRRSVYDIDSWHEPKGGAGSYSSDISRLADRHMYYAVEQAVREQLLQFTGAQNTPQMRSVVEATVRNTQNHLQSRGIDIVINPHINDDTIYLDTRMRTNVDMRHFQMRVELGE